MKGNYTCNLCKKEGKETIIPADKIGMALMKAHLVEKHSIEFSYKDKIKVDEDYDT